MVFGNQDKLPKIGMAEDGTAKGILVDILGYISSEAGIEIDIQLLPWARAYARAKKGDGAIVGLSWTEERSAIFDYSKAVFNDDMVVVVDAERAFEFESIDDLRGKRIGVLLGASFGEEFETAKDQSLFTVAEVVRPEQRLLMLLAGRIDAFLIGPGQAGLTSVLATYPEMAAQADRFVVLPTPFQRDPNYLGFLKGSVSSGLRSRIDEAIERGHREGHFDKIVASTSATKTNTSATKTNRVLPEFYVARWSVFFMRNRLAAADWWLPSTELAVLEECVVPERVAGVESHVVPPQRSHRDPPRDCASKARFSTSTACGSMRLEAPTPRHRNASAWAFERVKG